MAVEPHPIVTLAIDGIIQKAECSICGDPLALEAAGRSAEEQAVALQSVFEDHVRRKRCGSRGHISTNDSV